MPAPHLEELMPSPINSILLALGTSDSYRECATCRPKRRSRGSDLQSACRGWAASDRASHRCTRRFGTFPTLVSSK